MRRFVKFVGYKGYIVLKDMEQFANSRGAFLILFNHLVEQYRRGAFSLHVKEMVRVGGLLVASEIQSEEFFEFTMARYLIKSKFENGISK